MYETKILDISETFYPYLLKTVPNPPRVLYYKGNVHVKIFENCLGVIGSRKISAYGLSVIGHFFKELSAQNLTIVSGFMRGTDINAHKLSIEYKIPTIAVLPYGIDYPLSTFEQKLASEILDDGGLIVSEYEKTTAPRVWTYVKRNRIVAGLCKALLVVEAGENSGSLITYRYAKSYQRKILAAPGDIFRDLQKGVNTILREGGIPVFSGQDINKQFGLNTFNQKPLFKPTNLSEKLIVDKLLQNPCDINILARITKLSVVEISSILTNLEISGKIKEEKGILYAC